jgi:hypothetical protein
MEGFQRLAMGSGGSTGCFQIVEKLIFIAFSLPAQRGGFILRIRID